MRLSSLVTGLAIGAGLMYYLDPDRGRRRRALVRDQLIHLQHELDDVRGRFDKYSRHLNNRMIGLKHQTANPLKPELVDDEVLIARVRSSVGRSVSHPHAIKVTAHNGHVILSGPVLAPELNALLSTVRGVRGVSRVDNWLNVYEQAENLPTRQESRYLR